MWGQIVKFVISIFWAEIKKYIAKYIKTFLEWLVEEVKEYFSKRNSENAEEAEEKAAFATRNAEEASEPTEADKWRAIASVWREVAEKFRKENERLEAKLTSIQTTADIEVNEHLEHLEFRDAFEVSENKIKVIDNKPIMIEKKS